MTFSRVLISRGVLVAAGFLFVVAVRAILCESCSQADPPATSAKAPRATLKTSFGDLEIFPADNPWNQQITNAPVADLFKEPLHPYTQGLLRSIPRIDLDATERRRLETIPGTVPTLRGDVAPGCRFAPRCPFVKSVCTEKDPILKEVKPGHKVSCWLY